MHFDVSLAQHGMTVSFFIQNKTLPTNLNHINNLALWLVKHPKKNVSFKWIFFQICIIYKLFQNLYPRRARQIFSSATPCSHSFNTGWCRLEISM